MVATEFVPKENVKDSDSEKFMQPEDLADHMIAQVKLNPRVFIPSSSLWTTNPF